MGSHVQSRGQLDHRIVYPAGSFDPVRQCIALSDLCTQHVPKCTVCAGANGMLERASNAARRHFCGVQQYFEPDFFQHLRFAGLVEDLKSRWNVGLKGKQMQQLRAEGMNGLHFQSARSFQSQCEQTARAPASLIVNAADAGLTHGLI